MNLDELRELCLSLPGTHEKETWGDAEHAGDITSGQDTASLPPNTGVSLRYSGTSK